MNDISIGVIGAGGIAQVAHLPVISRTQGARVVALCDTDINKARALASRFEVPHTYDDVEQLFTEAKPDAVVICTPNHMHEVHVGLALSAGAHVLCERPLALTSQQIAGLNEQSKRCDRIVMVGMNNRYRKDSQVVRQFLDRGELGELRAIRGGWLCFKPSRTALGWRLRSQQSGGGVMMDLGHSLIDLALWLVGGARPVRVSASYNWDETETDIEDAAGALITCENGLSIFVDVSWRYLGSLERFWFELHGTRGSAALGPLRVFTELHGNPVDVSPTRGIGGENQFTASYRAEWANFLAAVRGDIAPPDLNKHVVSHRVIEAANQSAREGRDITL